MKTLVLILVLSAFLQTTILSISLCLLILSLRAFIRNDAKNLYLAFSIGLVMSLLDFKTIGLYSLIYLLFVVGIRLIVHLKFSNHLLIILPTVTLFLIIEELILSLVTKESLQIWPLILVEILLILPIYILIKFWEERFITHRDIKLRV